MVQIPVPRRNAALALIAVPKACLDRRGRLAHALEDLTRDDGGRCRNPRMWRGST